MHRGKKQRKIIIISLVSVLFLMMAGYAAFSSNLKISGTSQVTSNWDIEITNVSNGTPTGSAENASAPTWDKLTASMEANLYDKNDSMEYDVTIENKGTIDAKLDDITTNLEKANSAVLINVTGYTKGEKLLKGTAKTVHVKIAYNPDYTGGETSSEINVNFNYVQNDNIKQPESSSYLLTYDYSTNGGNSVDLDKEYLTKGDEVNLNNKAVKDNYKFVGWNIDKDAQIGLNNYQMPGSNTTLYAIYSRNLKVTYSKDENITSIGKDSDSCTIYNKQEGCNVTLPAIVASSGFNVLGWHENTKKVGVENDKYLLKKDTTLIAKASEPEPIMMARDTSKAFWQSTYQDKISTVDVLDNKNVPSDAVASWDVSEKQNKSVMAWIINDPDNSGMYKLYIGGKGKVIAPADSSYLFYGLSSSFSKTKTMNLTNLDTSRVTNMSSMFSFCSSLTSLDLSSFNTSKVTKMNSMFSNCSSLTSLDVSNFDTSNVTKMYSMFGDCNSLTSLDLSNFNTSKVTDMNGMFAYCRSLTSLDVSNFDTSNVTNMSTMFSSCSKLTNLDLSNFNTSNVTSMRQMFYYCSSLTSLDVSNFNTSNVTNMSTMFSSCSKLTNLNVSNFDTSKVTNMYDMFRYCSSLTNLDVSNFDTSKVTNMSSMFSSCSKLTNLDVSNFDTSKVANMDSMFAYCRSLTSLDVSNFDTSKVTDMSDMFYYCSSLTSLKLCSFDTSKVTKMNYMFRNTSKLTKVYVGPKWTTVNATTTDMFTRSGVSAVTQSNTCELDVYGIAINNISSSATVNSITLVTDASSKSGSITKYEFSKDNGKTWINNGSNNTYEFTGLTKNTDYKLMVRVTNSNNQIATKFINVTTESIAAPTYTEVKNDDSSDVTIDFGVDCSNGTYTCSYIKDNGSSVSVTTSTATVHFTSSGSLVAKITAGTKTVSSSYTVKIVSLMMARDTSKAFWQSTYQGKISTVDVLDNKNVPSTVVASWDVSEKQNKSIMAWIIDDPNNSGMYKLYIGGDGGVAAPINSSNLFDGYKGSFSKTKTMNLTNLDTSRVTNMSTMFRNCISLTSLDLSSFDTSNVTSMYHMFSSCSSLTDLNLSSFKTNNVTDMNYMFDSCSSLTSLDVSKFNTSNVTNMYSMFGGCSSLTNLDVSNFNTSNVTGMGSMFSSCSKLTNLDVSNFDTSNVTDMGSMFNGCSSLTNLDVSKFNTSKVMDMSSMFNYCSSLTNLDVSKFNTSNVTNMFAMFVGCSSLNSLDVSKFNTSKVTKMGGMFAGCSSLTSLNLGNFDTSKVTDMSYMFLECSKLTSLDVSNFDTSNVTSMSRMFDGCSSLINLDVSSFNTSKVTDMRFMFNGCSSLASLDLSNFNTSSVTDMGQMFFSCSSLANLNVSNFDTSNVTNMIQMFYGCSSLTSLKLCSFDTSQVTGMSYMFENTSKLAKVYVGPKWTTANATTTNMFNNSGVSAVTQSNTCELDAYGIVINNISSSATVNSITLVTDASSKSGSITKYEFSKDNGKTWINNGSNNTYEFTGLTKNTDYKLMVRVTNSDNQTAIKSINVTTESIAAPTYTDIKTDSGRDVTIDFGVDCSNSTYTCSYQKDNGTFVTTKNTKQIVSFTSDGTLVAKITAGTKTVSSSYTVESSPVMMARDDSKAFWQSTYSGKISTVDVLDNKNVPSTVVASWDVSEKQNKSVMAWIIDDPNNSGMYKLYIGGDDGVTAPADSSALFNGAYSNFGKTKAMNLAKLNTSKTTNMREMFRSCGSLTSLDLSNFNTSNVTDMSGMFAGCGSLTSLDVSSFNTSNVTNMGSSMMNGMFANCSSLISLDLSNFDTSKVTDMSGMFHNCSSLINLDVSNFDTSNVTRMTNMFESCSSLPILKLCSFDMSNIDIESGGAGYTSIDLIFADTTNLTKIYVGPSWNFDDSYLDDSYSWAFEGSGVSEVTHSNTCEADAAQAVVNISTKAATNSITVIAVTYTNSNIVKYEYSKDNGTTWIDNGTNNTYTFASLTQGTSYNIKVRVTDKSGKQATASKAVTTGKIQVPTFEETGTDTKAVTITYPAGCGSTYTCSYQKDNESSVTVTTATVDVQFKNDGTVVGKVSDGVNAVSSSYTVSLQRQLDIGRVKGGNISLSKSSESIGNSVTIQPTATSGFTYNGATIVCQDGSKTTTSQTTFKVPNCSGTITVYPTWKKNDYIWFWQGKGSSINKNNINLWSNTNYDVYKIPLQYISDYDYVRMDAMNSSDSRNNYATNSTYDLTDYSKWVTTLDCYCNNNNCDQPFSTSQGIIRYWKNIITGNTSSWNTNNYSTTLFDPNSLDISNINGNRYLQLHMLVNGHKFWCGWTKNYLEGTTYTYENRGITDTKTGWQYENGNYYYYDASGNKKTGWLNTAETPGNSSLGCTSQWYYLESDGKMATGWYKVGNSWYYLAKQDGKENKWNTAQTKGCMYTGWVYSEDYSNCASHGWYFDSSGAMVSNTTINGSTINSSGCWVS